MYNRLYKHLKGHSTDHALLQLVDQIYESFERNEYTIGVFIDLSKAFDTVDHNILLKKWEIYCISDTHLQWFWNYLSNRKQYIQFDGWQKQKKYKTVKYSVPQGSILEPVFLLYINFRFRSSWHKEVFSQIARAINSRPRVLGGLYNFCNFVIIFYLR